MGEREEGKRRGQREGNGASPTYSGVCFHVVAAHSGPALSPLPTLEKP